eukprot:SM006009S19565  [mRNA]  locus=s6009:348:926:+ [translate_table: standard]
MKLRALARHRTGTAALRCGVAPQQPLVPLQSSPTGVACPPARARTQLTLRMWSRLPAPHVARSSGATQPEGTLPRSIESSSCPWQHDKSACDADEDRRRRRSSTSRSDVHSRRSLPAAWAETLTRGSRGCVHLHDLTASEMEALLALPDPAPAAKARC